MLRLRLMDERIALLPQRAAWWEARSTLLLADAHLGKTAAFRRLGVPAPEGTTDADLARLSGLLDATGAERLIILGDLLHARDGAMGTTRERFDAWRASRRSLAITLVQGNHDVRAGRLPEQWGIEVVEEGALEPPFALRHEPAADPRALTFAGHLHPGVIIGDERRKERMRMACFWRTPEALVFPAFGSFTGLHLIRPGADDSVYGVGPDRVMDVTRALARPRAARRRTGSARASRSNA